jgi:hypothetical protein
MEQVLLYEKIEELPDNMKQEVYDFIEFLKFKKSNIESTTLSSKRNGFGCLKDKITISDDFDAPLEEFKEYV